MFPVSMETPKASSKEEAWRAVAGVFTETGAKAEAPARKRERAATVFMVERDEMISTDERDQTTRARLRCLNKLPIFFLQLCRV